jgi:FkbM family methyltransferase
MIGNLSLKNFPLIFSAIRNITNWPTYFLDFFNLTNKKNITYTLRDGTKFFVRAKTTDRGIVTSVALIDEYKIKNSNLGKNSVIIDIGGQIGIFTSFASKYASKIYTYEPTKENYKLLKKNISINNLGKKVKAYNMAVYDTETRLKIYLSKNNTGGHSAYGSGKYETVKTTTLTKIFEDNDIKKCSILKLDAEGSEYSILYSTPKKYFNKIEKIYLEYHDLDNDKKNHKYLIKFLKKMGYNINYSKGLMYAVKN